MSQLSDEQESELVRWVERVRWSGCVVDKDMIRWYAGCLLHRDKSIGDKKSNRAEAAGGETTIDTSANGPAASPPPRGLGSEFVDAFLDRHPDLVRRLKIPEYPVHPSDRSPADKPVRVSRLDTYNEERRVNNLYEDRPRPPPRVPAAYPQGDVIYYRFHRFVVRNNDDNTVTKFITYPDGFTVNEEPNEAVALRFVKEHTTIPVPAVISAAYDRITTEYIEGLTLMQVWHVLLPEQRTTVLEELRGYIAQLRSLDGAKLAGRKARRGDGLPPRIGRVNGEGALLRRVYPRVGGPFDTAADLHNWLVHPMPKHEVQCAYYNTITRQLADSNCPVVFSHGDISASNILVRDGHIVALLDWESAGWYPEYWDYVYALEGLDNIDWETLGSAIPSLFETRYDKEFILLKWLSK